MLEFIKKNKIKLVSIFTTQKNVEFKILNLFGLQILRYSFSKIMYLISGLFFYDKKILQNYDENGYLLIDNFLDKDEYIKLKDEFEIIINTKGKNIYDTATATHKNANSSINHIAYEFQNDPEVKVKFPSINKFYNNVKVCGLFKNAERKNNINLFMRIERIETKDEFKNDANAYWHADTFHDTHKGWLYLTDVKKENGPFNYLVGSSRFSFSRMMWEYHNSIQSFLDTSLSYGFLNDKLSHKYEAKKIEVTCKENSFLMANTHGYHRRGDAEPNQIRDGFAFYVRENPFKKF
tara:strand:+ start:678 stop:1556 length:879 start_codon:yes stop_codon:yes gene_type:complete